MRSAGLARAPRRAIPLDRSALQAVAVAVAPAALAFFVAVAIAKGRTTFAIAPVAGVLALLLSRRAWLPYLVVLATVATFADPYAYRQFTLAGFNPFVSELVLLVAIGAALLAADSVRLAASGRPYTVKVALAVFIGTVVVGVVVGMGNGATFKEAILDLRPLLFVSAFWLALPALATPESRRRVFWIAGVLAAGVVVFQFAQIAVGTSTILFYTKDPFLNLVTCASGPCGDPAGSGFLRVRPPGLNLVYVTVAFSGAYLLWGPPRRRLLVGGLFALCLAGVLASLNRNMVLGLLLGLILTALVMARGGRLMVGVVAFASIALVLVLLNEAGGLRPLQPVLSRAGSLIHPHSVATSASATDRSRENHFAFKALRGDPITGIGWGTSYGKTQAVVQADGEVAIFDQPFIHNIYLGLWLRTGIVGLLAYVTAVLAAVGYGIRWCRRRWDEQSWLGAAVVFALVANALSVALDVGTSPDSVVPFVGVLALAVTLGRRLAREGGLDAPR
jgi:O-antigen ligase